MKINIFPIVSSLHSDEIINDETKTLLSNLKELTRYDINIVDIDSLYDANLSLILIQSGGSEQLFLENLSKLKPPYYLLTYGSNNSLAASMEILSYLKDHNLEGEILHGDVKYIAKRINTLASPSSKYRYGVIGKPSDWLISSSVDYEAAKKLHNIDIIDIKMQELIDIYNSITEEVKIDENIDFDKKELSSAEKLNIAINKIKENHNLDGLTIRCFDLLSSIKTTACLSLAKLNQNKVVGTCEGDVQTMITMHVLKRTINQPGFQANPSRIDVNNNEIVFAHCTLPLDMATEIKYDTHFESKIGVGLKGKMKEGKVTIFKLSKDLKNYFISTGTIVENLNEENLCRTQIKVHLDESVEYFLKRPFGNHHVIVYGDHKKEIEIYMRLLQLNM